MTLPHISCNVVDRRSGLPAAGVSVLLRCVDPRLPHSEFEARTDPQGYVFEWSGRFLKELTLYDFLCANSRVESTIIQIGFLTTEYFYPVKTQYNVADVNFVLFQGQQAPHVTLFADVHGYGTWIEPLKDFMQRPIAHRSITQRPIAKPRREYQKLSKDQNKALKQHFVDEPYPSAKTYQQLSEVVDLSKQKTMQWFRRERAYRRRENHQQQMRSMLQQEITRETDQSDMGTTAGSAGSEGIGQTDQEINRKPEVPSAVIEADAIQRSGENPVSAVSTDVVCSDRKALRRSARQARKVSKL